MSTGDDQGLIDLDAICARPSARPAQDLTPPDLRSLAPSAFTTDLDAVADTGISRIIPMRGLDAKAKKRLAFVAGGTALLAMLGIGIVVATSGSATANARQPASLAKMPPANAAAAEPPPAAITAPPPAVIAAAPPPTSNTPLPPPPTTGAAEGPKPPPRAFRPVMAAKPAAPAGPKMIKVQSTGVPAR